MVLGVTTEGYKEILGIIVVVNESSKFWLGMLNDLKKFVLDFKAVYNAPNEKAGLEALEDFSFFFQFCRIMYDEYNRRAEPAVQESDQNKKCIPQRQCTGKMLYLASLNVAKKWTQRYRNWNQVLNQLTVLYG